MEALRRRFGGVFAPRDAAARSAAAAATSSRPVRGRDVILNGRRNESGDFGELALNEFSTAAEILLGGSYRHYCGVFRHFSCHLKDIFFKCIEILFNKE